jgi:autotransporter-associated beta strand protein
MMRTTSRFLGVLFILSLAAVCAIGWAGPAQATTYLWTGGAGATWNTTDNNWGGGTGSNTWWDITNGLSNVAEINTAGATLSVSGTVYTNGIVFSNTAETISGGTINLAGTTPTITINIAAGLIATIGSALTGTSGFIKDGAGSLQLNSGSSTYTGATTIKAGTLRAGGSTAGDGNKGISSGTTIYLGDTVGNLAATILLAPSATTSFSNNVIVQSGNTGEMTFYAGRILNFPGTMTLGTADSAGHSLTIRAQGWDLSLTGVIRDPINMTPGTAGIVSIIGGADEGVSFHAANTYTGNTQIRSGKLALSNALGLQYSTLDMNSADAGTLIPGQNSTLGGLMGSRNVNMNGKTVSIGNNNKDTAYSGILSNGALTKIGTGTLTLSNTSNSHTGTTINAGTLAISGSGKLGATSSTLTLGGGTLDLGTTGQTAGAVSITAAAASGDTISNGTLTGTSFAASNTTGNAIISASLAGSSSAGLTKSGAGTVTLSGANSYTGNTTISGGTLAITGSGSLASPEIKVLSGGTLDTTDLTSGLMSLASGQNLTGNGIVSGAVTLDTGGKVTPGIGGTETLTVGSLTATGGGVFSFTLGTPSVAPDATSTNGRIATTTMTISGTNSMLFSPLSVLTTGYYQLISFTDPLSSWDGTAFTLPPLGSRYSQTISKTSDGLYLYLTAPNFGEWYGAGGNWTTRNPPAGPGWSGDVLPSQASDVANFLGNGSGTIAVDTPETVGIINLNNSGASYAIGAEGGTNALTMDNGSVSSQINNTGTHTINAPLTLAGSNPLAVAVTGGSSRLTISGAIDGTPGIILNGGGTLTLAGANNYAGTTINAATLAISGSGTLGATGGTLTLGGGSLDLGTTSQTVGAVSITTAAASGDTIRNGSLTGASYSASNTTGNAVISANLLGTGITLSKSGAGILTLSGANTYSGDTTVSAGTLNLSSQNALQNSTLTTGGTGIVFDSSVTGHAFTFGGLSGSANLDLRDNAGSPNAVALTVGGNGANTIFTGALTGSGSLVKVGDGSLQLGSNNSTYTGSTTIKAGTLIAGGNVGGVEVRGISANSTIYLGDTTGNSDATVKLSPSASVQSYNNNVIVQSGNTGAMTLYFGRVQNFPGTITLGTDNLAGHNLTIQLQSWDLSLNGLIQDPINMTLGTAGTVSIIGGDAEGVFFKAANTYTGNTQITSGKLTLNKALALQNSTLDMNSADAGTLIPSQNSTLGGLMGSRAVDMNGKTLSIGNNNQSTAYSGILSNGALTKIGTGTLALTGANIYSGGTTVSSGKLLVNGDQSLATGAVSVGSTGTLGGTGFIGGAVTVTEGGILAPGDGAGTLTVNNSVAMDNGSTYVWQLGASTADLVDVNGSLAIASNWSIKLMNDGGTAGPDKYNLFTYDSFSGDFTAPTIDLTGTWTSAMVVQEADAPGAPNGPGRIYLMLAKPGDTNSDFVVDAADYIAIKTNFGAGPDATRLMGDLSGDGWVNWTDLQELMDQFGTRSVGGAPAAPEPGSVMLLMFGAAALLRRRRAA